MLKARLQSEWTMNRENLYVLFIKEGLRLRT